MIPGAPPDTQHAARQRNQSAESMPFQRFNSTFNAKLFPFAFFLLPYK
jgi:hypothetical protein